MPLADWYLPWVMRVSTTSLPAASLHADPEPRQEDEGGRPHQPLPASTGQLHQRTQRKGWQPGAVCELPGQQTDTSAEGTKAWLQHLTASFRIYLG